jgi:DDE domain
VTARRTASVFAGLRFPREVISLAVRWYLRYGLPYRDVEELLAERGITVDHVTVYRWVRRFTPEFIKAARPCRHVPGDRWFVDETYVKVAGKWMYLYRAVDQHGQVIDMLLSAGRDLAVARRFFTCGVPELGGSPLSGRVLRSCAAALRWRQRPSQADGAAARAARLKRRTLRLQGHVGSNLEATPTGSDLVIPGQTAPGYPRR